MVISSEEVKILDENCIELGISIAQLMENAGAFSSKIILEYYPHIQNIAICCGTGNNGGDGMVIARHLSAAKKNILLFFIGDESKIRSKTILTNYSILKQMEESVKIIHINDSSNISILKTELLNVDLIVDALLGIGLTTEPYEPIKSAIKVINNSGKLIVSIDLPSGMFSDIPEKTKTMINANKIITFYDFKPCITIPELKEKVVVTNIGIPLEANSFVGKGDLRAAIPLRNPNSHKGDNGLVLVVGGSENYFGAPLLASRAVLRTGADLSIACVPNKIADAVRADTPNIIVKAFEGNYFKEEHISEIIKLFTKFNSIIIGPGLGENPETMKFVINLLNELPNEKPVILDADALKAIKNNLSILKEKRTVLTPHTGEFKMLFGNILPDDWQSRKNIVSKIARDNSTTILLKSRYDIISNGIFTKVNRTGHVGMTVGGTGDVLTGILGALIAVNKNLFRCACAAAYINGKAGEYAAEDFGNSLLATDVIEKIPDVLLSLETK